MRIPRGRQAGGCKAALVRAVVVSLVLLAWASIMYGGRSDNGANAGAAPAQLLRTVWVRWQPAPGPRPWTAPAPERRIAAPAACAEAMRKYFHEFYQEFQEERGSNPLKARLVELRSEVEATGDTARRAKAIVDVGANLGQMLPTYEGLLGDSGLLYLFEASSKTAKVLAEKVAHNPNITVRQLAIAEAPGERRLKVAPPGKQSFPGNELARLVAAEDTETDDTTELVRLETLDRLFLNDSAPVRGSDLEVVLLKSDTEGFDFMVMLGAKQLLHQVRFYLYECHYMMMADTGGPGSTFKGIAEYLTGFGFDSFKVGSRQWLLFNDEYYAPDYDGAMHWGNCFAMRRTDPLYERLFSSFNTLQECDRVQQDT